MRVSKMTSSVQPASLFSSSIMIGSPQSDVYVPDICGCRWEVLPLTDVLNFHGNWVLLLLCLSETGFQQRLDLFLTRSETVLKSKRLDTFENQRQSQFLGECNLDSACHGQMYPPGHSWWSVPAALSVSETSWHCPPFSSVSPPLLPPCCLLLPWTEG